MESLELLSDICDYYGRYAVRQGKVVYVLHQTYLTLPMN